jgi:putative hemolysin
MSELVSKPDFIRATNLNRLHLGKAAGPLMKLAGISRLNELYEKLQQLDDLDFIDALLKELHIELEFSEKELARIPTKGPFITVSNHPFGLLDGLILIRMIASRRPDFKVMANFLLHQVAPVKEHFIYVNPFEEGRGSLGGMKQSIRHLEEGGALGIFPAGEVSSLHPKQRVVTDRPWSKSVLKLIKRSEVPVLPVFFQGKNSALFQLVGLIHPRLRTVALPSEMLKKQGAHLRVRIGQPISVGDQSDFQDLNRYGRFLRAKTYSLGSTLKVSPFFRKRKKDRSLIPEEAEPIAPPMSQEMIEAEIEALREKHRLVEQKNFEVFATSAHLIPNVMQEIGRLREITFREVNEGSLRARDLDEYDLHYLQLFLWDREEKKICGAYRIGQGDLVFSQFGKKGFYIHSLFKIKKGFAPYLQQAVELGRSFVLKEYQRKRLPLFLLWKGINMTIEQGNYRYIIGPVSISNHYARLSKRFMVAFIKKYHYDPELAAMIRPRKRFRNKLTDVHLHDLLEDLPQDLNKVDKVISDMEPDHFKLPILLKKYIKQNAKIISFNIDPKFNNALDGLMILDLQNLPPETSEGLKR